MTLSCWSCGEVFTKAGDLRTHYMNKPHQFLQVICPFCEEPRTFRRPIDLRTHIDKEHRKAVCHQPSGFPSDKDCFFLAREPRAYRMCMSGKPEDSLQATFLKEAILKNPGPIAADRWQKGWDQHGPTSTLLYSTMASVSQYSPTKPSLYETVKVSIEMNSSVVVLSGPNVFYRITYTCNDNRSRERFMRLMGSQASEKPIMDALPTKWEPYNKDINNILRDLRLPTLDIKVVETAPWSLPCVGTPPATCTPPTKRKRSQSPLTPLQSPKDLPTIDEPSAVNEGFDIEAVSLDLIKGTGQDVAETSVDGSGDNKTETEKPTPTPTKPSKTSRPSEQKEVTPSDSPQNMERRPTKSPVRRIRSNIFSSMDTDVPTSISEPILTIRDPVNNTAIIARSLMLSGGMPLFPPARRNWEGKSVLLPLTEPFKMWPPVSWQDMSGDTRNLMMESVATSLAMKWKMPLDREYITDCFNFLILPGSSRREIHSRESHARHSNLSIIKKISFGEKVINADCLISMYQFATSKSVINNHVGYTALLNECKDVPLMV